MPESGASCDDGTNADDNELREVVVASGTRHSSCGCSSWKKRRGRQGCFGRSRGSESFGRRAKSKDSLLLFLVATMAVLSFSQEERSREKSARELAGLISLQELEVLQAEEGVGEPGELERIKVSRTRGCSEGSRAAVVATTTRLSQWRSDESCEVDVVLLSLLLSGWMEEGFCLEWKESSCIPGGDLGLMDEGDGERGVRRKGGAGKNKNTGREREKAGKRRKRRGGGRWFVLICVSV
jgi:hypothetical protein